MEKGKINKFVTQYELLTQGQWYPVIRYDTAHDFVHIDRLSPAGTKRKTKLHFLNYNEALTHAILDLTKNWKKYKNQFLREIKNEKR